MSCARVELQPGAMGLLPLLSGPRHGMETRGLFELGSRPTIAGLLAPIPSRPSHDDCYMLRSALILSGGSTRSNRSGADAGLRSLCLGERKSLEKLAHYF